VGPVRPFSAVCNAVASADVSDVTVSRDVPDDVEVGSLVAGLLRRNDPVSESSHDRAAGVNCL